MAAADEQAPQFQVYVSPVPKDMDDAAFAKAFAGCGAIDQARVVRKSRSSKLFGFVDFKEKAGADAAIAGMNGKALEGSDDTIEVSESKPKKPRFHVSVFTSAFVQPAGKSLFQHCRHGR